ncbi:unnamed protein product [Meloidogyne enterolobii]|uniref:Uncharacterized protein n=1 Tax=Meloidogyne enterolobii TaxID=390850 RepID=A0ACB1B5P6_MELEN
MLYRYALNALPKATARLKNYFLKKSERVAENAKHAGRRPACRFYA